nr:MULTISPECIES: SulP family inorganic anion transporter [unclassified Leucobacter]
MVAAVAVGSGAAALLGQGLANLATGLFQGMPVGGSMSATALVRSAGGRSALANLVAAIVMALVILVLGQVIGFIAMPALAGLLILVGIRAVKPRDIAMVMRTGPIQLTVLTVTFVLTLIIPLQYAVIVGVGLAIVLHVARQSNRVVVKRWEFGPHAHLPVETDPPRVLAKSEVVVLVTYGSLFFASAPVFSSQLPEARGDCTGTVVILRLRGKDELGSTVIKVLEKYAADLRSAGGMLVLAGVNQRVHRQLRDTKVLEQLRAERVLTESPQLGESLQRALRYASEWQAAQQEGSE